MLDDKASVDNYFPENLSYGGPIGYNTPYALLCFDTPQNIKAWSHGPKGYTVRQVTEINLETDPESWRKYDGQTITVAISSAEGGWPTGLNTLRETGRFKNSMLVWKD